MSTGILVLAFGEPPTPDHESVVAYLERIFYEGDGSKARERARTLAQRRAPELIEEYETIGGSPLNDQARAQADALEDRLRKRGFDVATYVCMQFTDPLIEDVLPRATENHDRVIGLPVYPLCGPSTTIEALERFADAIETQDFEGRVQEIVGWHRHPKYLRLRADVIKNHADAHGISLTDPETTLVFSAHGTPLQNLEDGSRYQTYVEEYAQAIAGLCGLSSYELGYQNHENRGRKWTEPPIEKVIESVEADRVVVDPMSFMHEQSETLGDLDIDLRQVAESRDLGFHRVPIPHDDERFIAFLEDLLIPFLADFDPAIYQFRQCECRDSDKALCLNAPFVN